MIVPLRAPTSSPAHARGRAFLAAILIVFAPLASLSAHVVKGILYPTQATAFVSSPSAAEDVPVAIRWATVDTGLRIACFNVANTSPPLQGNPGWPKVTAFGFELSGAQDGLTLLTPSDGSWQVVGNVPASLLGRGTVTLDFAIVSRGPGLSPGQPAVRGSGTRFCLSGPFQDGFSIEQLINGVVVGFQAQENGPLVDLGLWDNAQRVVPLFP
jgi:hypothetical protein